MCAGVSLNIHSFIGLFFSLHNWCNKGPGMCYPFCGIVHIKEPLLLIGKSSPCGGSGFPLSLFEWSFRCHYTKSNPIDDHSNISSKRLQMHNFKPLYLHAVWYLPFTNSPRKHTVTYHFSDLQEVYSGNRQIHTKCQLQYLHPPHISTSGKCHCVIIHQTTKATEYTG